MSVPAPPPTAYQQGREPDAGPGFPEVLRPAGRTDFAVGAVEEQPDLFSDAPDADVPRPVPGSAAPRQKAALVRVARALFDDPSSAPLHPVRLPSGGAKAAALPWGSAVAADLVAVDALGSDAALVRARVDGALVALVGGPAARRLVPAIPGLTRLRDLRPVRGSVPAARVTGRRRGRRAGRRGCRGLLAHTWRRSASGATGTRSAGYSRTAPSAPRRRGGCGAVHDRLRRLGGVVGAGRVVLAQELVECVGIHGHVPRAARDSAADEGEVVGDVADSRPLQSM